MRQFRDTLPRDLHGNMMLNLMQIAIDVELDSLRISALANALVKAGLVTPEQLCVESTALLKERNDGMSALVVASRLGVNGKRVS